MLSRVGGNWGYHAEGSNSERLFYLLADHAAHVERHSPNLQPCEVRMVMRG